MSQQYINICKPFIVESERQTQTGKKRERVRKRGKESCEERGTDKNREMEGDRGDSVQLASSGTLGPEFTKEVCRQT